MDKLITNLDTNLGAVLREQLDTNFQKIQNGVDGQADSVNKQILNMLGPVAPQDQNEVTQARIDANGKSYDTLKGREDVTQTTAETALSEERATSVEVQDARTNSSSQTYPTLKERMDSQENDLTNNMNAKISQISSVPETFANLSALKSTYPNGKTGLFVTADTGHKFIWANGSWSDAGFYQSVGISDASIRKNMLAFDPLRLESYAGNYVRIGNINWGAYREYTSGKEIQLDGYFYVKMPVVAGSSLYVLGTIEQMLFTDESGSVIKGYVDPQDFSQNVIESPTVDQVFIGQVPANATIAYVTFKAENYDKAYVGYQQVEPMGASTLSSMSIAPESIPSTKLQNPSIIDGNVNLFDKTTVTPGKYVDYASGNILQFDSYSLSDWIPVDPRLKYKITNCTEQLAIYDGFKAYITGVTSAANFENTSLPTDARFIRLTIKNDTINSVQIYPIYYFKKEWMSENVLVDKSGKGDFLTLKDALNGTHEGAVINLNNDIELTDEYSESEINDDGFWGIPIADEKTINGNGHTIHCDLPATIVHTRMQFVSTLMIFGSCKLKDLTISANRARYAIHIDWEGVNDFFAERVHFKMLGTTGNFPESMGGGLHSGQHHLFKDCTFETDWSGDYDIPASYHTFTGLTAPTSAKFDNCTFINKGKYNFRIGDLLNDMKLLNVFEFVQCRIKNIYAREELKDGSGLTFTLRGAGNSSELALDCSSQSGTSKPEIDFVENINVSTEGTRTDDY